MPKFLKALFAKSFLKKLAGDNNSKTSVLGFLAAALLAANVEWSEVFAGEPAEIGQAAGVLIAALWGWFTNRPEKPKPA